MKSILTETVLLAGTIMFWSVALPAAIVVFPALALCEKIGAALFRAAGPGCLMGPSASTA